MELIDILEFAVENGVLFMTICYFMYNQTTIIKELTNSINDLKLLIQKLIDKMEKEQDKEKDA
ncbi:MAG: hypothetical protein ACI4VH_02935 [Clostridia bacterium]